MEISNRIDTGVLIYLGFINTFLEGIKHPENKKLVLARAAHSATEIEDKYKIGVHATHDGLLEVDGDVPSKARAQFFELLMDMVEVVEDKYGAYNTWKKILSRIQPIYSQYHQEIFELGLEIPLGKYELEFVNRSPLSKSSVFKLFFGLIGGEKWSEGVVFVTNKKLVLDSGESESEIEMSNILTVGREVYSDVNLKYSHRSVNLIDYKATFGIAAFMYDGRKEILADFNRIVARARVEAKGLTALEKRILLTLDSKRSLTTLLAREDVNKKTLALALSRLREIDYITKEYEITSYGLNALAGLRRDYSI